MSEPLNISRAICVCVAGPLDLSATKAWRSCVAAHSPTGTVMTMSIIDDKGCPQSVAVVHREVENKHSYLVPLTRDLTEMEGERIAEAFAELFPELDFDISMSSNDPSQPKAEVRDEVDVGQAEYVALCTAWAKRQHDQWMKQRLETGWTYGTSMSMKNKTHPLLRPWSDLPDEHRIINLQDPQMLLDLLNEQGYMVISKTELEAVLKLIRTT